MSVKSNPGFYRFIDLHPQSFPTSVRKEMLSPKAKTRPGAALFTFRLKL
jgi:hypothetical protein